jgi:hypothetical protein
MKTCPACSAANPEPSPSCSACGRTFDVSLPYTRAPSPSASRSDSDSAVHGRFLPGTKIADRYRIVSLVGRGGMGEVYRADDLKLGHSVALKFLPRDVAEGSAGFQLFLNEVRLSRQVAHPNVCRVYDALTLAGPFALAGFVLRQLVEATGDALFPLVLWTVVLVLFNEAHPVLGWFSWGIRVSLLFWVFTRLGFLVFGVASLTVFLLMHLPLTTSLSAWYAGSGLTAVALLLAVAAFGFFTSQAGRPLFQAEPAALSLG